MKRLQVAVIGFGRVGRACAAAILEDEELALAGIVRRREALGEHLLPPFARIPVVSHVSELGRIDAALICVPTGEVLATARELLQHRIPVVECATLHGEAWHQHQEELNRSAVHHKVSVIVGAGWDPGALSLFRALFALLTPKGHTETSWHTAGTSLHHTTAARNIPGVREALATELRRADGSIQRYVYIEIAKGGELAKIEAALCRDPLFLNEETLVFPVEDIRQLEEEGHGVLLERQGITVAAHQRLLLEARYFEPALCAAVMTAAARALPGCRHQACSLLDLPLGSLWGELQEKAKREWL